MPRLDRFLALFGFRPNQPPAAFSDTALGRCFVQTLTWEKSTTSTQWPYTLHLGAKQWRVRLNDFPEEPLYSLFIDDCHIGDFDDWPESWQRASSTSCGDE